MNTVGTSSPRNHAIVMGASMAGLLAARVLSDHFGRVTLIDRDRLPEGPENRKGVPQGRHLHALLVRGEQILSRLFPGLAPELIEAGADWVDLPGDVVWFQERGYKVRFPSGIRVIFMTRALLENRVRRRVLGLPNIVCLEQCDVEELTATADGRRVTGIRVERRDTGSGKQRLEADLIVDATGRGSKSPRWLEALGFTKPRESIVKVDVGYTTRVFARNAELLPDAKGIYIMPAPPHGKRCGGLFPIEGGRWLVTLCGWLGDHAPANETGFLEYARSLPSADIHKVISRAEPLSDFVTHGLPSNQRRHYEFLTDFPHGYLVMGDAMCSFNPVYGQGMSVSAMEAEALNECLLNKTWDNLARAFFKRGAQAIDSPWKLATGEDFRFPEVQGVKAPGTDLINRYVSAVHKVTHYDQAATRAFFQVMTLTHSPGILFRPGMVFKVLKNRVTPRTVVG